MIPKERLEEILKYTGNSYNSLKTAIKLNSTQNLYDIRDLKVKSISLELATKIHAVYPEFSMEWLRHGKGNMIVDKKNLTATPTRLRQINANPDISKGFHSDTIAGQSQSSIDAIEKMLNEKLNPIKEQLDIISRLLKLENRVTKVENKLDEITGKSNNAKNQ